MGGWRIKILTLTNNLIMEYGMEHFHYGPGDISFIKGKFRQKLAMRVLFRRAGANLSQTFCFSLGLGHARRNKTVISD